jgi:SLBB domain
MIHSRASFAAALVFAASLFGAVPPLPAQDAAAGSTRTASRADLERLQAEYEQQASSTGYSERARAKARLLAVETARRLREGDFRVGDRIHVRVDGGVSVEDTATVTAGPRIQVRGIRQIELAGVLRSELALKVTAEVREIVKEATVSVRPLTRVAVFGAVAGPGYFAVPVETTLDQLISLAGGPTTDARTGRMRLLRAGEVFLDGSDVTAAIAAGRTIDALDARDGDVLELETVSAGWQLQNTMQVLGVLISPVIAFFLLR